MRTEKTYSKFRKRFGQHFLQDGRVIENIISSSNTKKSIPESSNKDVKREVSDGS